MVVTSYSLEDDGRKNKLGTSNPTDANGFFSVSIKDGSGPILLEATPTTDAQYVEPANGMVVAVDTPTTIKALVTSVVFAEPRTNVTISPISHLAHEYAYARLRNVRSDGGIEAEAALANQVIGRHFGEFAFSSTPLVLAPPANGAADSTSLSLSQADLFDAGGKFGLILAGLSQMAVDLSLASKASANSLTTLALMELLSKDISDPGLLLDGKGEKSVAIGICPSDDYPCAFDANTVRSGLAEGIVRFLESPRNRSALTCLDAQFTIESIRLNKDPLLFPAEEPERRIAGCAKPKITAAQVTDQRALSVTFAGDRPCFWSPTGRYSPLNDVPAYGEEGSLPETFMYSGSFGREAPCTGDGNTNGVGAELKTSLSWIVDVDAPVQEVLFRVIPPDGARSEDVWYPGKGLFGDKRFEIAVSADMAPLARQTGVWRVELKFIDRNFVSKVITPIRWQHNVLPGPIDAQFLSFKERPLGHQYVPVPEGLEDLRNQLPNMIGLMHQRGIAIALIRLTNTGPAPLYLDAELDPRDTEYLYYANYQRSMTGRSQPTDATLAQRVRDSCANGWLVESTGKCVVSSSGISRQFKTQNGQLELRTMLDILPPRATRVAVPSFANEPGRNTWMLPGSEKDGGVVDVVISTDGWEFLWALPEEERSFTGFAEIVSTSSENEESAVFGSAQAIARLTEGDVVESGTALTYLTSLHVGQRNNRPLRLLLAPRVTRHAADTPAFTNLSPIIQVPFQVDFVENVSPP